MAGGRWRRQHKTKLDGDKWIVAYAALAATKLRLRHSFHVLLVYFYRGSMQEHLDCIVSAIDSISYGDLVDVMVRRRQNWNLLPTQVHATVLLCTYFCLLNARPYSICRILIQIRFSESVHLVRKLESRFMNPANPVLTWIHYRNQ